LPGSSTEGIQKLYSLIKQKHLPFNQHSNSIRFVICVFALTFGLKVGLRRLTTSTWCRLGTFSSLRRVWTAKIESLIGDTPYEETFLYRPFAILPPCPLVEPPNTHTHRDRRNWGGVWQSRREDNSAPEDVPWMRRKRKRREAWRFREEVDIAPL
jgi:hypothetical protein